MLFEGSHCSAGGTPSLCFSGFWVQQSELLDVSLQCALRRLEGRKDAIWKCHENIWKNSIMDREKYSCRHEGSFSETRFLYLCSCPFVHLKLTDRQSPIYKKQSLILNPNFIFKHKLKGTQKLQLVLRNKTESYILKG